MFKFLSLVATVLFLVVGVTLGVLNPAPVELDLLLIKPILPLSLILAVVLILGMLLGAFVFVLQLLRLKWLLRKQIKLNQKQSDQILQLKKSTAMSQMGVKAQSNALIKQ